VKVLLAGLGSIGQRHARNLRTLLAHDVELLAYRVRRSSPVLRPDLTAAEGDVEATYDIRSFDDLEAALAEQPDAVFVTNPNRLHVPVALAAAEAGCHLFIEKPISDDLAGVPELIELIDRKHLVCLVAYQLRFHPALRHVQECLGDIGPLLAARIDFGEYLPGWHPYEDYRELHVARSDQGGGVLLAQIHDLDLACVLFGFPRRVFALGGQRTSLDVDVEDAVSVLLDCDGVPVHVQQDLVRRPPVRRYEIVGEAGTIVWDYYAGTVAVAEDVRTFALDRNEVFMAELRHFLSCLADREQPVVDARGGANSLRIVLAAKESMSSGEAVSLGPWTSSP
jgi:predicted dehydrogenase